MDLRVCGFKWTENGEDHDCLKIVQPSTQNHVCTCCCGSKNYDRWDAPTRGPRLRKRVWQKEKQERKTKRNG